MRRWFPAILLVAASCCLGLGPAHRELSSHRDVWRRSGVAHYEMVLLRSGFLLPEYSTPVRVVVQDGRITSATYVSATVASSNPAVLLPAGSPVPEELAEDLALTVPQLFEKTHTELCSGAHRVEARYDDRHGYVRSLFVDRSARMVDEEYGITVEEFRLLP